MGYIFRQPDDIRIAESAGPLDWGAFTLGVAHTTPLDLANSFATLSAEGIHCDPIPVEEIRDANGQALELARPDCGRTVKRDVALAVIDAGKCVVGFGSHFGECRAGGTARWVDNVGPTTSVIPYPVWGKTGTADGERTYSFVLSTKQLAVAGQMADPDWAETTQRMDAPKVRTAVALTLRDAMKGKKRLDWGRPSDMDLVYGPRVQIPDVECLTVPEAEARLTQAGFEVQIEPRQVDSACPAGRAARPEGGRVGTCALPVGTAVALTRRDAMKGKKRLGWGRPSDMDLVYGPRVQIPGVECLTVPEAEARLTQAGFEVQIEPRQVDSACPAGRVA